MLCTSQDSDRPTPFGLNIAEGKLSGPISTSFPNIDETIQVTGASPLPYNPASPLRTLPISVQVAWLTSILVFFSFSHSFHSFFSPCIYPQPSLICLSSVILSFWNPPRHNFLFYSSYYSYLMSASPSLSLSSCGCHCLCYCSCLYSEWERKRGATISLSLLTSVTAASDWIIETLMWRNQHINDADETPGCAGFSICVCMNVQSRQ